MKRKSFSLVSVGILLIIGLVFFLSSKSMIAKSKFKTKTIGGIEFVFIPGGCFNQGSNEYSEEKPVHRVCVKPFWMGKHEVTQAQWEAVMGNNPSRFQNGKDGTPTDTSRHPVEQVSWDNVQEFIKKFNAKHKTNVRLPSESQWEYAARGGTSTAFYTGDCISTDEANYNGNYPYSKNNCPKGEYRKKTIAVGSFKANQYGLHDMSGNVWEWVEDCWNGNYEGAPTDGSVWSKGDCSNRVNRGGGWYSGAGRLRSAGRDFDSRGYSDDSLGLRLSVPASSER